MGLPLVEIFTTYDRLKEVPECWLVSLRETILLQTSYLGSHNMDELFGILCFQRMNVHALELFFVI